MKTENSENDIQSELFLVNEVPASSAKSSQSRNSSIISSTKQFLSRNLSTSVSKSIKKFNSLSKYNRRKHLPERQEDFTFFSLRQPSSFRHRQSLSDIFKLPDIIEHSSPIVKKANNFENSNMDVQNKNTLINEVKF
mgnify:CR=1 FL=1